MSSFVASPANAQAFDLAQSPLLTLKTAPGLVMLNMGRDIALYKAAYNDVNDLDGDGIPDIFFKPAFKYEGYFAYDRCYTHDGAKFIPSLIGTVVVPNAADTTKNYYKCPLNNGSPGSPAILDKKGKIITPAVPATAPAAYLWSGNFLNWLSMARIDVLRKVLYGGKRSTDTGGSGAVTVLERTFVPQDSTIWGKEYTSVANDGYDIRDYAPLTLPTGTTRHMFANVTLDRNAVRFGQAVNSPLIIVYQNRPGRIWDLVADERLILGENPGVSPAPSTDNGTVITQYIARVETCKLIGIKFEDDCTAYTGGTPSVTTYKPTGLLQKYGEAKTLAFGLLSGSYDNNYAGGVVRKNIDDFNNEVNLATGQFNSSTSGIVYHLSAFRPWGFAGGDWGCGSFTSVPNIGDCPAWGNPLGEIIFEGLNYFAGGSPTSAFTDRLGGNNSPEPADKLGLKSPAWANPYAASTLRTSTKAYPSCARPVQMTIGDPKTSFDTDQLPGSMFPIKTGFGTATPATFQSLNVSTEADLIWTGEFGNVTKRLFIGEAPGDADGNPSAKAVSSFKNIRGHGPDATNTQGGFYGASVARFGKFTGLTNPALPAAIGNKALRVDQISIALDSHIPKIQIPLNGKMVSIVLLSKSVGEYGISNARGDYQQTGAITAFFIDQLANTNTNNTNTAINGGRPYYKFRISFSDSDQGTDNESDAKVTYEIKVLSATTLSIGMDYFNGSNGIEMHQGYVIAGTTTDGVYLDTGGGPGFGVPPIPKLGYFLDTMPASAAEANIPGSAMLAPATGPGYTNIQGRLPLTTLANPRIFRAGAGNTGEFVPQDMLWYAAKYGGATRDSSGSFSYKLKANGDPENYFLANNPSQLSNQIGQAFQKAASLSVATSSAPTGNGVQVGGSAFSYISTYDTIKWGGDLRAFPIDANGDLANVPAWQSSSVLPAPVLRTIAMGLGGTNKVALTPTSYASLDAAAKLDFNDENTFKYLLGVRTSEQSWVPSSGGNLRDRSSALGDVINSDPIYINQADFGYTDTAYQSFKAASAPQLVGFGANDGFYHLVSATDGVEKLAFMPLAVRSQIAKLAQPGYDHKYYVDGPGSFGHVKWSGSWKSVVAAGLGAGGKSVFAINTSSSTPTVSDVLWEFGDSSTQGNGDLGNILNKPIIGMLDDGTTPVVIVSNGLNSNNGKATLFVLNAQTGVEVRRCTPVDAANVTGNGLGPISFVSSAGTGKISFVYGADIKGNVWRFDPSISGCAVDRIYSAKDPSGITQAITGDLTVIKAPANKPGYMVLFGTGSYATSNDPASTQVQSLYGIWDNITASPFTPVTRAMLATQSISNTTSLTGTRITSTTSTPWFATTTIPALSGWVLDLTCSNNDLCQPGERSIARPTLFGTTAVPRVYFLTFVPGLDPCQIGGGGWLTSIDPASGSYSQGIDGIVQNSTFIPGAAPRGIYVVERKPTSTNQTTGILLISSTRRSDETATSVGSLGRTGVITGVDGTTVGQDKFGRPGEPIPPGFGTRRQVWRQIQ